MDPMVIAAIIVALLLVIGLGWWAYSGCKLNAHLPRAYQKKICPATAVAIVPSAEGFATCHNWGSQMIGGRITAVCADPGSASTASPASPSAFCRWGEQMIGGRIMCAPKPAHAA